MRAVIYTIYQQTQWTWRVSLDVTLNTDQRFWSPAAGGLLGTPMYRVTHELPYGQALALAAEMNSKAISEGEISSFVEHLSLSVVPWMDKHWIDKHWIDKQSTGSGRFMAEDSTAYSATATATATATTTTKAIAPLHSLINDTLFWDRLRTTMRGRSLLWEELVSLLEYLEVPEASSQWKGVTQWAYLRGDISLEQSLTVSVSRSAWSWGKQVKASCKRCGHGGEQIRWSICTSCGESCAYCESCLTLGRTRACAPLITGMSVMNETTRLANTEDKLVGGRGEFDDTAPFIPIGDWQLSPAQLAASEEGIRFLLRRDRERSYQPFLIWAVTIANDENGNIIN